MACGSRHVVAVTHDGTVYCWGDNRAGQCGQSASIPRITLPAPVPLRDASPPCRHDKKQASNDEDDEREVRVLECAAGDQHTLVLSDYGELWTWGTGVALGLTNASGPVPPTRLDYLQGRRVLAISSGANHNLVLIQKHISSQQPPLSQSARRSGSVDSSASTASRDSNPIPCGQPTPRYRPATCTKCRAEMNGFDELDEEEEEKCPLGLSVQESLRSSTCTMASIPPRESQRSSSTSTLTSFAPKERQRSSSTSILPSIVPSSSSKLLPMGSDSEGQRSSAGDFPETSSSGGGINFNANAGKLDSNKDVIDTDETAKTDSTIGITKSESDKLDHDKPNTEHELQKIIDQNEQIAQEASEDPNEVETVFDEPISAASTPTDSHNTSISSGSTPDTDTKDAIELNNMMTTSTGSLRVGGVTKSRSTFLQDEEEAKVRYQDLVFFVLVQLPVCICVLMSYLVVQR